MLRSTGFVIVALGFVSFSAQDSSAQMFGARNFGGSSLQPQSNPGGGNFGGLTGAPGVGGGASSTGGTGTPSGTGYRFMRDSRSTSDFVGSDGSGTRSVGNVQAGRLIGNLPAALEVVERRVPENLLNPPRPPLNRSRMYEPKLDVAFLYAPRPADAINANLQSQINRLALGGRSVQVTTFVDGATVRLEGLVGTEDEKALIGQMVLFEPGISAVENDLKVLSSGP